MADAQCCHLKRFVGREAVFPLSAFTVFSLRTSESSITDDFERIEPLDRFFRLAGCGLQEIITGFKMLQWVLVVQQFFGREFNVAMESAAGSTIKYRAALAPAAA